MRSAKPRAGLEATAGRAGVHKADDYTARRMRSLSSFHRCWVRLLALLMLAVALLPAASRALAAGEGWVELCTPQGMRWVSVQDKPSDEAPTAQALGEHCKLCQLQAQGLDLPPQPLLWAPLPVLAEAPPAFYAAPQRLPVWRTAAPRGPPVLLA